MNNSECSADTDVAFLKMVTDLFERFCFSDPLLKLGFFSSSRSCFWSAFCETIEKHKRETDNSKTI